MSYFKNDLIRVYPDVSKSSHYTCVVLEDNGRVLEVKPHSKRVFESLDAWKECLAPSMEVRTHTVFADTRADTNPHAKELLEFSDQYKGAIEHAVRVVNQCCEFELARQRNILLAVNQKEIREYSASQVNWYDWVLEGLNDILKNELAYKERIKNNTW